MALKGFLASGFQKLIGASRLKGANNQYVGEPNKISYTSTTVPIASASAFFGHNYLDWAPSGNVSITDTTALFSSNPTTETLITIRNSSLNKITIDNNGSVAGSCSGFNQIVISPNQCVTYMYDATATRWREIARTVQFATSNIIVTSSVITAPAYRQQAIYITASSDQTVNSIQPAYTAQIGDTVTLYVGTTSNTITIQQDTTDSLAYGLITNGDYAMTKYSAISFVYNGFKWIETGRNMVGGY